MSSRLSVAHGEIYTASEEISWTSQAAKPSAGGIEMTRWGLEMTKGGGRDDNTQRVINHLNLNHYD